MIPAHTYGKSQLYTKSQHARNENTIPTKPIQLYGKTTSITHPTDIDPEISSHHNSADHSERSVSPIDRTLIDAEIHPASHLKKKKKKKNTQSNN